MRCALVLVSNAAFEGLLTGTGFVSAGIDRCAISCFASKPGRNLKAKAVVVGLRMWESLQRFPSLALCARRHVQAIRLLLFVLTAAGDKLLLCTNAQTIRAILLARATAVT